jgi:hypothetical protein
MGDRSNVCFRETWKTKGETKTGEVWLYAHWSGERVIHCLAYGLRTDRATDLPYLVRIVFDQMTEGDKGTTGFGISSGMTDNEHPVMVVSYDWGAPLSGTTQISIEDGHGKVLVHPIPYQQFLDVYQAAQDSVAPDTSWDEDETEPGDLYFQLQHCWPVQEG